MDSSGEVNLDDSLTEYQKAVRGRAHERYDDVRRALSQQPVSDSPERLLRFTRQRSPSPRRGEVQEHSDYTYGAAADQLRSILDKYQSKTTTKNVQFQTPKVSPQSHSEGSVSPGQAYPRVQAPSGEEVIPLLQKQALYIQQLEGQIKYAREELLAMQLKVRDLVEENRYLREELKHTVVEQIMGEEEDNGEIPRQLLREVSEFKSTSGRVDTKGLSKKEITKWQCELERMSALHLAKTSRLEAQLTYSKEELQKYEQTVEDLKAKLRVQEAARLVDNTSGELKLCVKCAQDEALLPQNQMAPQAQQLIDRLTQERDSLMDTCTRLKARVTDMLQREEEAYIQVKKSVELVEHAQLERTEALVQREQVKEELANMRNRLEEHVTELQNKMTQEREIVRKECKYEMDELKEKVRELLEYQANAQVRLDKLGRERDSLIRDLEEARKQIEDFDSDMNKTTGGLKFSMTQATVERSMAIQEMTKLKTELDSVNRDREQDRAKLKAELDDVRRRLMTAEKELMGSKEECISLTTQVQALHRETHLAKLAKESIERGRGDELKAVTIRAERREDELNQHLLDMEARHEQTTKELEDMLKSQNVLVQKMKDECRHLAAKLVKGTGKYRDQAKKLANENDEMKLKYERALKRARNMENQYIEHGHIHEKLQQRLRQMDEHAQHSAQQILDLLAKQSSLLRDRQVLAREVEFLRQQKTHCNDSDIDKLYSSQIGTVDDILECVHNEHQEKNTQKTYDITEDLNV